jgi:L-asparaginase
MHAEPLRPAIDRRRWSIVTAVIAIVALLGATLLVDRAPAVAQDEPDVEEAVELQAEIAAEDDASDLPKVTVVATGGTLAGSGTNGPAGFQNYRAGSIPIERLVEESFELGAEYARSQGRDPVAEVDTVQVVNKGSGGVTFDELLELSAAVDEALETSDGVVVTSGTDTMEEIGRFLDLTVRSPKPVVMTGAMRPWDVMGTDGPANLYNAITTAASGKTDWFGTVLMLNDEIHAVADVTKGNTYRMDTFETPQLGMLGYVDGERVRIFRAPPRALRALDAMSDGTLTAQDALEAWQTPFDLSEIEDASGLPRVEIFYGYHQGGGGDAIDAWTDAGVDGIVTAGTGAGGGVPGAARNRALGEGVVFVTSSRTGSGSVYSGSGAVIPADNMRPQAARILLMLALAFNDEVEDVRADVLDFGSAEADVSSRLPSISDLDEEPAAAAPTSREDCDGDGWQEFTDPSFPNRGRCVAHVATNSRGGGS